jgi:glycosyltransferase involved in cell wall biosynthesis
VRILLHSRSFPPRLGGIEQASFLLARELAGAGHEVVVATDATAPPGADAGLAFEVLRGRSLRIEASMARRCDLVHANGHGLRSLALASLAGRPLVFTHTGFQAACLRGSGLHEGERCGYHLGRCAALTWRSLGPMRTARLLARHPIARASLHAAAANVCVSKAVARFVRAPRSSVIFNCADTAVFRAGAPTRPRDHVLFVGRLVGEKGVAVLLQAVAHDKSSGGPLRVELVGAGPQEAQYRHLCESLSIQDRVSFRGPLRGEALAQAMRDSAAVVVPTLSDEAFGLVAAEALSCGRIPIVSDRGGLPEVVEGLDTVVTAGDVAAWAGAMRRALEDTAWRSAVEARAGDVAARFTPGRHLADYLRVYGRVLDGGAR